MTPFTEYARKYTDTCEKICAMTWLEEKKESCYRLLVLFHYQNIMKKNIFLWFFMFIICSQQCDAMIGSSIQKSVPHAVRDAIKRIKDLQLLALKEDTIAHYVMCAKDKLVRKKNIQEVNLDELQRMIDFFIEYRDPHDYQLEENLRKLWDILEDAQTKNEQEQHHARQCIYMTLEPWGHIPLMRQGLILSMEREKEKKLLSQKGEIEEYIEQDEQKKRDLFPDNAFFQQPLQKKEMKKKGGNTEFIVSKNPKTHCENIDEPHLFRHVPQPSMTRSFSSYAQEQDVKRDAKKYENLLQYMKENMRGQTEEYKKIMEQVLHTMSVSLQRKKLMTNSDPSIFDQETPWGKTLDAEDTTMIPQHMAVPQDQFYTTKEPMNFSVRAYKDEERKKKALLRKDSKQKSKKNSEEI